MSWTNATGQTIPAATTDNDRFTGTAAAETANGLGGHDTLLGQGGNDSLYGGDGNDMLQGGASDDVLDGGAGSDTLDGDVGNNALSGGDGDDVLLVSSGNDTLAGGSGIDEVDLSRVVGPVTVDLTLTGPQVLNAQQTIRLSGIENLTGTGGNDVLRGDNGNNALFGLYGSDLLSGGGGDDLLFSGGGYPDDEFNPGSQTYDVLDGGDGNDTVSYERIGAYFYNPNTPAQTLLESVYVDLRLTAEQDTRAGGIDTFINIENVIGTSADDTLIGNGFNNLLSGLGQQDYLMGGDGHDTLLGGDGDDTLDGGNGGNVLDGGNGADLASYIQATAGVVVSLAIAGPQSTGGAGIDTLINVERLSGSNFNDTLTGTAGNDTLLGNDGTDFVNYADAATAVSVNLGLTGTQNTQGAGHDQLFTFEGVIGSAFNDTLQGISVLGTSTLFGGAGDDVLIATSRGGLFDGGAGMDTLTLNVGNITIDLSRTSASVSASYTITILNIENIIGSSQGDFIYGSNGNNIIESRGGGDAVWLGQGGVDVFDGGTGIDTVNFFFASVAVAVDLSQTAQQDFGVAGKATILNVESVLGTNFADTLMGDAGGNSLTGFGGHDWLEGGAGNDTLDGADGVDTAAYASASSAVAVSLNVIGNQNTGGAGIDRLIGIENLRGSAFNDALTGNDIANTLEGGAGNDTLIGGAGNDTVRWATGDGNDTVTLGTGNNTLDLQNYGGADWSFADNGTIRTFTHTSGATVTVNDWTGTGTNNVTCFYPGTMIATPMGERAVETLAIGDWVLTVEGQARPVRWMGRQTVSTRFADPLRVLPIRIQAGALAENVPSRDLLLSPDHAILVQGVLVQAGALVNGDTITREARVPERFTYHHVELADHSLILAENTPAETFVDNVDRLAFDNWHEHEALYGHLAGIVEMTRPRAKSHRQVPRALRQYLAARAVALAQTSAPPRQRWAG